MNKTLRLIALCSGSAVLGGFIALRIADHPPAVAVAATQLPPVKVAVPADASTRPAAMGPRNITAQSAASAPLALAPAELRDDYDFDSLAGPSQGLANRFDGERTDPDWAPRAINAVNHELEGQAVYPKLSSIEVDCRATLCRIQATLSFSELQTMMGPNGNFSWGAIVSNFVQTAPLNAEFDNTSDMESMDRSLGQAQFVTYLHRRPQSIASQSVAAS